jgi:hypothetical protein
VNVLEFALVLHVAAPAAEPTQRSTCAIVQRRPLDQRDADGSRMAPLTGCEPEPGGRHRLRSLLLRLSNAWLMELGNAAA